MLELSVAKASMRFLKDARPETILINMGVAPESMTLLTGTVPWAKADKLDVCRTLDALLNASCDEAVIPRIQLPAEFIAGAIAEYVHPVNTHKACS